MSVYLHGVSELRKLRGLTQEDLAKMCSLSQGAISRIERGIKGVSAVSLIKIAESLEVEVEELVKMAEIIATGDDKEHDAQREGYQYVYFD